MPTTPPTSPPTTTPPVQPGDPPAPPRGPLTFIYNVDATTDASDPKNYFSAVPGQLPQKGDTVDLFGNTMTVQGRTLDGTNLNIGKTGAEVPMPDPVLNLIGDTTLGYITVQTPKDNGGHSTINVTGENVVNLLAFGTGDDLHPTKASVDINVADNSTMIGSLTAVHTPVNIHAMGKNATFELAPNGFNDLAYDNNGPDGYVHIEPNMIGTGQIQMAFSNVEVSGSVASQVEFDLNQSSALKLDHADTFHGIVKFGQSGSSLVLQDFQQAIGTMPQVGGGLFSATDATGHAASFQLQYDTARYDWNATQTPAGLDVFLVPR